ncbi:MAG TPA: FAD-dependent oxidoreductase [Leptolyngbyaceae cyanobacterium M33_DOE_097]|uniref:FAD-dependent oxidoreductase n=1 Tax=Oscillatoriales cyanobacterium SpSt-418 TaxID=2282169 RepID=A0A7C3KDF9_9CYAN|nr:FAD-dependent oxidoreductase [Leptolyngbyaceae cyanobacterium M33_DOE_097]
MTHLRPWKKFSCASLALSILASSVPVSLAQSSPTPEQTVECEILLVGGGLAAIAAAEESLLAGRTVCMTEITDWMGGQLTAQGTSALDEAKRQRELLFYPRGYKDFRQRIEQYYGRRNPGDCWVSASCFLPRDAEKILRDMLKAASKKGKGELRWLPNTVVKELEYSADGKLITGAIAIQHRPAAGTPPLNSEPLSQIIEDAYRYEDSTRLDKTVMRLMPKRPSQPQTGTIAPQWIVVDATETGELIALADVPYQLGLDPRDRNNPSSPVSDRDPYCTQGFTYTFAMERTAEPQPQVKPPFYEQYEPYYGYDPDPKKAVFDYVFTYRRIWNPKTDQREKAGPFTLAASSPGSISMQNWVWGNDYRPGNAVDNLVYSREQLQQAGQLAPGGWLGGLRTDALRKGEEIALGYYYWLVEGTTDSLLQPSQKTPQPNHRLMTGLDSPMGTMHGLSKYPYIRETRRIIGRPSFVFPQGFTLNEVDISANNFEGEYYKELPPELYRNLRVGLAGLNTAEVIQQSVAPDDIDLRGRSTIYPDAIGIAQYAIDFHPCMQDSPPEKPGNIERPGVRQAHGQAYPGQIPLRSMIPQKIDNLLVSGKSIATSYSAAAAYRVHSFEWSIGAATGITADFVLSKGILPYQLVDELPRPEPQLEQLQQRINQRGNPTAFPNTTIFNTNWKEWRVW